ncbi:uncharacterized protein LOC115690077 [Syzygium oleosum]|uniref:uncharacterized protein LOC115690077 n=1 Tax=Syzygium oleosum TaxID=219896 RepID=UPI0011D29063|nr:uncharacterized protein LOC115690077 [Syzygium oleosum]XP_030472174.1 uncharacterized protein LOC115690077 [Syzygium oleosum]XP_056168577.1 uncharacterized protein LOC115690077 [Syzygium oleosum]
MGCLLGCFNASKHQRRPKSAQISPSKPQSQAKALLPAGSTEKTDAEALIEIRRESRVSDEKQLEQLNHGKKKVAFDLHVKTYEFSPAVEEEEEVGVGDVWIEVNEAKERESGSVCRSTLIEPNGSSCAWNNRYTDCASSDDELGGTDLEEIDVEEDGVEDEGVGVCDGEIAVQEESSESLFSLSIDSRKHSFVAEVADKEEVNSPFPVKSSWRNELNTSAFNQSARLRIEHIDSVLNPVENLPQRKAVTARANSPIKNQDKENVHKEKEVLLSTGPKPTFAPANHLCKPTSNNSRFTGQEIAVDTSLSSWLVDSEATPKSKCSNDSVGNSPSERASTPRSDKGQPVVEVPIVEDLRQFSASTSPRWLRGRTPDESPVLGTVGSYWSHTGQAVE